ncbi:MAG: motility protein A [bacterium]|nr:motility protein A [bacterium]
MDFGTIIGLLLASILVLAAILTGESPIIFLNAPSALVVIGGTIGATLIRNPVGAVLGTFGVVMKAFTTKLPRPNELADEIVELARTARKNSLLSLEKVTIENPFLAKGVQLCVDGLEPAQLRSILETDMSFTIARHKRGQEILEGIGSAAPAFGMIGTLIGLVQMLTSLDDPKSIGPAMAVAILTTLYGALMANVFALPLADKLKVRSKEEALTMAVCLEGVLAIVQGDHPASIDEKLKAFLEPKKRTVAA